MAEIKANLFDNTTPRGYDELAYLVNLTVGFINKILKKRLEQRSYDRTVRVYAYKTPNQYKGRSFGYKVKIYTNFSDSNYPCGNRYGKFADMPDGEKFHNWQESFVGVLAHELAHEFFNGNRSGEFQCELAMHDALKLFRKETKYWKLLSKFEQKTKKAVRKVRKIKYGSSSTEELRKKIKELGLSKSPKFASRNFYLDTPEGFEFENQGTCAFCEDSSDALERLKGFTIVPIPKTENQVV